MSNVDFPRSPAEIDVEWLNSILREAGALADGTIVSVDAESTAAGFGVVSWSARLRLTYEQPVSDAPQSLFAKSSAGDPAVRARMHGGRLYEREVRFYRDVAPAVRLRTPRCYFAAIDAASGHSLLLLEDLACARPGDDLAGCSTAEAEALFRQLAACHAQWWQSAVLQEWSWLPGFDGDPAPFVDRHRSHWTLFTQRLAESIPAPLIDVGERALSRMPEIRRALAACPATFAHGDFRLDDVLFDAPDQAPVFVDWQLAMRAPGAIDIARFLVVSLTVSQRRADEDLLVRAYHTALVDAGVREYTLEVCRRDVRLALLNNLFRLMQGATVDRPSERRAQLVAALIERNHAALMDHDVRELLR